MALRIANFMDSSLEALALKGNLPHAFALYNPLGAAEKVVHFTPHPGDVRYAGAFADYGIEIFPFFRSGALPRLLAMLAVPGSLLKVIIKLRRDKLNVIRCRLPYFGSLIGCLAGRCLRIPVVVSLGGDNRLPQQREGRYYFGSRWISYGMENLVLRLCDVIVVPNRFTGSYVARLLGERRAVAKTVVIPWALDRSVASTSAGPEVDITALGLTADCPIVLIVGHLNRYKFAGEMFEVAAAVVRRRSGAAQFVFCGDGPLRAEGERRLADVGGAHLLGWQPNDVVLGLMARAAVVLVPMSGFVLLEAAALGKPVITSNIEWHAELVADGESGWLVPPESVSAWVERVCEVLDRPDAARRAGARLREQFIANHAPDAALRQEVDLYNRLIGASR